MNTGDILLYSEDNFVNRVKRYFPFNKFFYDKILGEYDNAGLIVRTHISVYVAYIQSGKVKFEPYNYFIADRNKLFVKLRFLNNSESGDKAKTERENIIFLEELKK
jgi:hypothetical protein